MRWWMVAAVLAVTGSVLGLRYADGSSAQARAGQAVFSPVPHVPGPAPRLVASRIPDEGSTSFRVHQRLLDQAARAGRLTLEIDGRPAYDARVEGWVEETNGRRSLIGRVATRAGQQALVLTVGRESIAGVIPRPDGRQYQVLTERGLPRISRAGGLVPAGVRPEAHSDLVMPPMPRLPGGAAVPAVALPRGAAAAKALPPEVRIDVLMLVSSELATLRGSVEAAETEATSMFATARQSYIDSGTRVRLHAVRYLHVEVEPAITNHQALSRIQANGLPGVDLAAIRTGSSADLVALVRPRVEQDMTCGVGYLNGHEFTHAFASAEYGFSVTSAAPCGPHVLAHELGHNLGSAHERDQYLDSGRLEYGAYVFSFGQRRAAAPAFATVMAYSRGEPWVGYFSSPRGAQCNGPCGVADVADNVRSLDLMAPVVAAFRNAPGTLSLSSSSQYEPDPDYPGDVYFMARLSGRAPAGGVSFRIEDAGGSARPGSDYEVPTQVFALPEGQTELFIRVPLLADTTSEGDEVIRLRLVAVEGAPAADGHGEAVLVDDDPRHRVSGRLHLPPGGPVPGATPTLSLCQSERSGCSHWIPLSGPDYRYSFGVVNGLPLTMDAYFHPGDPYVGDRVSIAPVRSGLTRDLYASRALRVHGRVVTPVGAEPLTAPVHLTVTHARDGRVSYTHATAEPPDYRYEAFVANDSWVTVQVDPAAPYKRYFNLHARALADIEQTVHLSALPSAYVWTTLTEPVAAGQSATSSMIVSLSAPAPDGGVRLSYRVLDGTARLGTDIRALPGTVEIPAGGRSAVFEVEVVGDDIVEGAEVVYVELFEATGAVVVAPRFGIWIMEPPRSTGGPGQPLAD